VLRALPPASEAIRAPRALRSITFEFAVSAGLIEQCREKLSISQLFRLNRPPAGSITLLSTSIPMTETAQSEATAQMWKLTLSYDGTDFHGWQVQPGEATIQGELQGALWRVTGENPLPQGSGRTDAGVHALAQVASFALRAPIPAENLVRALNRTLPASIRVLEARLVADGFHARHWAIAKTYEYRILQENPRQGRICPPFLARYVYSYLWPLDLSKLSEAARLFVGEHDFTSFMATDPDLTGRVKSKMQATVPDQETDPTEPPTAIRTVHASTWEALTIEDGDLLVYRVRGNGFLHHMVRNLVGTMLEVGRGKLEAEKIPAMLAARSRSAAGPTAPARGLFLHSVEYE
jgi:tRNA pseudouridine38-40 synthase